MDHPSVGMAIIGRMLEGAGALRCGISRISPTGQSARAVVQGAWQPPGCFFGSVTWLAVGIIMDCGMVNRIHGGTQGCAMRQTYSLRRGRKAARTRSHRRSMRSPESDAARRSGGRSCSRIEARCAGSRIRYGPTRCAAAQAGRGQGRYIMLDGRRERRRRSRAPDRRRANAAPSSTDTRHDACPPRDETYTELHAEGPRPSAGIEGAARIPGRP